MKDGFSFATQNTFPLIDKSLKDNLPDLPRREAQVAHYMLLNLEVLSCETGASRGLYRVRGAPVVRI